MIRLLTNFKKEACSDMEACIRISGLKAEIKESAENFLHEPLSGHYSVWYEDDNTLETEKAVERFFYCSMKIDTVLHRILIKKGIPEELLEGKDLYSGCEKDYFPEYGIEMAGNSR